MAEPSSGMRIGGGSAVPFFVDDIQAINELIYRLTRRWETIVPQFEKNYGYDPLPLIEFMVDIRIADENAHGNKFIDIGCGIGDKLALMCGYGYQVQGVEFFVPYVSAARYLVPEADIQAMNAFDLEEINADIVYMYRPMKEDDDQRDLEEHVISLLSPGNVLYLPMLSPVPKAMGMEQKSPTVWIR